MNRVYSILTKGQNKDAQGYQRKVDTTVGYSGLESVADILVTDSTDNSYYNYQADQLVQVCRKSLLKASLAAVDPLNTYEYTFGVVEPSTLIGALPAGVVNPSGLVTVNGLPQTFTVAEGLTTAIILADGLSMKLRGTLPAASFSTIVTVVRQPTRDLKPVITALKEFDTKWLPKYSDYRHSYDVNDWLAAFILNYCETVDGS